MRRGPLRRPEALHGRKTACITSTGSSSAWKGGHDMNAEQPVRELVGRTAIVVGAGRGLGRGIATALADAGAPVVAVARGENSLESLAHHHGITSEVADASDATVAGRLIDEYEPEVVVVVAGAVPYMRPLQQQTWETFTI